MGKHDVEAEEDAIRDVLAGQQTLDDVVRDRRRGRAATTSTPSSPSSTTRRPTPPTPPADRAATSGLYADDVDFLDDALHEASHDAGTRRRAGRRRLAASTPHERSSNSRRRADLRQRLDVLPAVLPAATGRVTGAAEARHHAAARQARSSPGARRRRVNDTTWPEAHYLAPLHPVLDWASRPGARPARAQPGLRRPRRCRRARRCCCMGTLTNRRGQLVSRSFSTVVFPDPATRDSAWSSRSRHRRS